MCTLILEEDIQYFPNTYSSPSVQDLFRAGIGAVLYIIVSLVSVIGGTGDGARIAGGVSEAAMRLILKRFYCLF